MAQKLPALQSNAPDMDSTTSAPSTGVPCSQLFTTHFTEHFTQAIAKKFSLTIRETARFATLFSTTALFDNTRKFQRQSLLKTPGSLAMLIAQIH